MLPWWYVLIVLRFWPMDAPPHIWSYEAPASWNTTFPLCSAPLQSPVALHADKTVASYPPKVVPASGLQYGRVTVTNTGRQLEIRIRPQDRSKPAFQIKSYKKPLFGVYNLEEIYVHWGDARGRHGSEHALNGKFAQAEIQMVFANSFYKHFGQAQRAPGGLAVISFLLVPADTSAPEAAMFPRLGLEERITQLSTPGSWVSYNWDLRPLHTLLSKAVTSFYSYYGSLTQPPCSPVVTWLVASQELAVSRQLLHRLTTGLFQDDAQTRPLVNNWRPLQEQRGRVIVKQIATNPGSLHA